MSSKPLFSSLPSTGRATTRSMTRNQNHNDNDDDDASSSSKKRKRFKTCDNGGGEHWSDLNHHMLCIVMMQPLVQKHISYHQMDPNETFQGGLVDMLSANPQQIDINASDELEASTFVDPDVELAMTKIEKKSFKIQPYVFRILELFGDRHGIDIFSPQGMYPGIVKLGIPLTEVLQLFLRGWLDVSILHWFAIHFFRSPNSKCAFFDPDCIKELDCRLKETAVIEHIKEICSFHVNKTYFLAPYLQSEHWVLFILCPNSGSAYILDSLNGEKTKDNYLLPSIIDKIFPNTFKWIMGKCNKQRKNWECGYMVIKHMREFVETIQHNFEDTIWRNKKIVAANELENTVLKIIPHLVNELNSNVFGTESVCKKYGTNHGTRKMEKMIELEFGSTSLIIKLWFQNRRWSEVETCCKKLVATRKQMSIMQAPNILVIQLNRLEGIFEWED
ncbi:unnamed protein product [Lactuca virosa]|uniref:Ubiquitin-like protease family profile domain-containing protein n=1 Tax=Lactuca virosa TaxID=75947 RepID=A0AAU9L8B1_9ASTR|nr:unnamed protein product [Lactuca virosa]